MWYLSLITDELPHQVTCLSNKMCDSGKSSDKFYELRLMSHVLMLCLRVAHC